MAPGRFAACAVPLLLAAASSARHAPRPLRGPCDVAVGAERVRQAQNVELDKWVDKNAPTVSAMYEALGITKTPAKTTGTMLVPSESAVAAFLKAMGLTKEELLQRKGLVDQILAYHFIPNFVATDAAAQIKQNPAIARTGAPEYILQFFNRDGKVWVQDVQGNKAFIEGKPKIMKGSGGTISVIPIDKVLMSGNYFLDGQAALRFYPQMSTAFDFYFSSDLEKKEVLPEKRALTLFVPVNDAWKGANVQQLKGERDNFILYSRTDGILFAPLDFKNGPLATGLKGHDLKVVVGPKAKNGAPTVTLVPEAGAPARIVLWNLWAGKAVFQGIDGLLDFKPAATAAEKGAKADSKAAAAPAAKPATAKAGGRKLLQEGGDGGGFYQSTFASTSASNTADAIDAAASGRTTASHAARVGSISARDANCLNCAWWKAATA